MEVGFGMAISATQFQANDIAEHNIIECNEGVLARLDVWKQTQPHPGKIITANILNNISFQLYQDQESGKMLHHFLKMVCSMESCTIHIHFPRLPGTLINSTLSRYITMKFYLKFCHFAKFHEIHMIFRHMLSVCSEVVAFSHSVTLPPGVNF